MMIRGGESVTLVVRGSDTEVRFPAYITLTCRGRRADLVIDDWEMPNGVVVTWRRLPVPRRRRVWAAITGHHRWVFEGTPRA